MKKAHVDELRERIAGMKRNWQAVQSAGYWANGGPYTPLHDASVISIYKRILQDVESRGASKLWE